MEKYIKRNYNSDDYESESKLLSKTKKLSDKKTKARPKRQYYNSYLKFEFHWTGSEDKPLPLCVVWGERISNEGMVTRKLKKHFTNRHTHLQDKN